MNSPVFLYRNAPLFLYGELSLYEKLIYLGYLIDLGNFHMKVSSIQDRS
jgi:hypothetical protein